MLSEELHIIGILDETDATGFIKVEELRALVCDYLQVAPYHPVLLEVLTQQGVVIKENAKIDIHAVFKALTSAYFNNNIPSFYNNRITKYSVKLIKAAIVTYTRGLLTMSELREGSTVHQMKEFETLSVGVPLQVDTIHSMLWVINKTISNAVLEKWFSAHSKFLDQPGVLMVHEFIYLLCNCMNKTDMYQKIPKIPMNPRMDKSVIKLDSLFYNHSKIKLFQIDKDFGKTYETPDHKIQHLMSTWYNIDKAVIEGIASPANKKVTIKARNQHMKNDQDQIEGAESFRKQLRGMVMTVGIKVKLKEYHQKLIRSRLNGKLAYDKLQVQVDTPLPDPMDLQSKPKHEHKSSINVKKINLLNRPKTGQQNRFNSFSGSHKNSFLSPDTRSPNSTQYPILSDGPKDNVDITKKRLSLNNNILKINSRQISLGSINSTKNKLKLGHLGSLSGIGQRESDVIPMFEKIISEEYDIFEGHIKTQNAAHAKHDKHQKSTIYFNSTTSPNMTRIYSTKPNSPLPASPLAEKFFTFTNY